MSYGVSWCLICIALKPKGSWIVLNWSLPALFLTSSQERTRENTFYTIKLFFCLCRKSGRSWRSTRRSWLSSTNSNKRDEDPQSAALLYTVSHMLPNTAIVTDFLQTLCSYCVSALLWVWSSFLWKVLHNHCLHIAMATDCSMHNPAFCLDGSTQKIKFLLGWAVVSPTVCVSLFVCMSRHLSGVDNILYRQAVYVAIKS